MVAKLTAGAGAGTESQPASPGKASAKPASGAKATRSRGKPARAAADAEARPRTRAKPRTVRRALYAGSFDPVTNGHLDIVRRGAALFDELVVAVGNNPAKRYLFALAERVALVERAVGDLPNVVVRPFEGLLVAAAAEHDARVLLRGLRGGADFDVEMTYALANRDLTGVETMFLVADPANVFVSSSIVKEIAKGGGDVARYVPEGLAPLIADRIRAQAG